MQGLTTITFFEFEQNKPWAFAQMGLVPSKLQQNEGLYFFKLMGTGGGNGFSLWPDFSTYAFLGVWKDQKYADIFLDQNEILQDYYRKSNLVEPLKCYPLKVMDCGVAKTLLRITLITSPIPISPWRLLQELL